MGQDGCVPPLGFGFFAKRGTSMCVCTLHKQSHDFGDPPKNERLIIIPRVLGSAFPMNRLIIQEEGVHLGLHRVLISGISQHKKEGASDVASRFPHFLRIFFGRKNSVYPDPPPGG